MPPPSNLAFSGSSLSVSDAVQLGAVDGVFFSNTFFPNDCRQGSPPFHHTLWNTFERNRNTVAIIFRGGAKTTIARHMSAKRIAYGLGHTILYIGPNEGHASEGVLWIEQQIEYNTLFASTFKLRKGSIWNATECEIIHGVDEYPIRVLAIGIMGAIRGINIGGYRPDTIICDDILDEDNTATPEQREKVRDRFYGAVMEAMVPESEDPTARLMLLQTPFDKGDVAEQAATSSRFAVVRQGILNDDGTSAWPQRWTEEQILAEKADAVQQNRLSLWLREKMVQLVSRETTTFKTEWLNYWDVLPPNAIYIGAIDPAPILSDKARATGERTDLQAIMVCAYWRGHKYIVEYCAQRDQSPEEVARQLERLSRKYRVRRWGVEDVAYQRTLKWYLEREMQAGRLMHLRIEEVKAPKGKFERIEQAHTGRASSGCLWVHRDQSEFIEQFSTFPGTRYKDLLDVSAMCDMVLHPRGETFDGEYEVVDETPPLLEWRAAP